MAKCGTRTTIGIISTITSILTGGCLFALFLAGSILFRIDSKSIGSMQTLCYSLTAVGGIICIFMLFASWTTRRGYRIMQIVVCIIFLLLYIFVILLLAGPIDNMLNLIGLMWTDGTLVGGTSLLEKSMKCCGYGSKPERCFTSQQKKMENHQDNSIILLFDDCRDVMKNMINLNYFVVLVFVILFMLYVISTGVLFIVLLKIETSSKIEDESSDFDSFGKKNDGDSLGAPVPLTTASNSINGDLDNRNADSVLAPTRCDIGINVFMLSSSSSNEESVDDIEDDDSSDQYETETSSETTVKVVKKKA